MCVGLGASLVRLDWERGRLLPVCACTGAVCGRYTFITMEASESGTSASEGPGYLKERKMLYIARNPTVTIVSVFYRYTILNIDQEKLYIDSVYPMMLACHN